MWVPLAPYIAAESDSPTYGVKELEGQLVTTMNCPDCGDEQTRVIDTETSADGTSVRRRRECQRCSFRFTTYERPEWDSLQVKNATEPSSHSTVRSFVQGSNEP